MKRSVTSLLRKTVLRAFDSLYLQFDHRMIRRAVHLQMIPDIQHRTGGKIAFSEQAHTVGIFQTMMMRYLAQYADACILDVGCGKGLLGIASYPMVLGGATYTGIDVNPDFIQYARDTFPKQGYTFKHIQAHNPLYAQEQDAPQVRWELADESQDLVTALSVWTHFNETDALFYLNEVARVLKQGAYAIITFFVLDEAYERGVAARRQETSVYHGLPETRWIFDTPVYGSSAWLCPAWVTIPEEAIGVTHQGLDKLLDASGLELVTMHRGNWREKPGVYFQDILILRKPEDAA